MSRLWYLPIGLLLFLSIVLGNQTLFLASLLLGLLAGTSYLWSKYCLVNVDYQRHFATRRLFWGDEIDVRIEIVNAKILPLPWLRIDDELPAALTLAHEPRATGYTPGRRRLINTLSIRWYERVIRRYRVRGIQRGVWAVGPTQLRSGDLFGFDIKRLTLDNEEDIIVYPRMVPVRGLTLPSRHPVGELRSVQRIMEDPLRLMGVREYAQGDSFRHIHWKATARRQSLQTKVFEPSTTQPVALFLNVNTYEEFGLGQDWVLSEYAICATASIARQIWQEGHALGLYANAMLARGGFRIRVRPRKHPSQLTRVLEALAHIDGRGRWSLEALLQAEATRLAYGTTLVIITPMITPRLRHTLADLQRKGYGLALIALGDAHLTTPLLGVRYFHIGGHERYHELETLDLAG